MSELLKERPLAVWGLFLAGAIVGGLSSALVQPQTADAVPQGLPHANARDIQEVKSLLEGISKTEEGSYLFDAPVEFKDLTSMVQLQISCQPDSLEPALSVCGPAQFESAVGPSCVVLNDHGVEYPEPDFAGPALKVEGVTKLITPEIQPNDPILLVDGRSKFTGTSGDDPLMTIMPLEQDGPAVRIEGRSLFTGDPGEGNPLVEVDPIMLHDVSVFLVHGPSKFTGTSGDDPLMAIMPLEQNGPALRVEGLTKLVTPEIHPPGDSILEVEGPAKIIAPIEHPQDEPLLTVQGPVFIDTLPLMPTIPALSILGLDRATTINPYGVELLTDTDPDAELLGAFKIQQDGTSLLKTDTVEAVLVKETGGPF